MMMDQQQVQQIKMKFKKGSQSRYENQEDASDFDIAAKRWTTQPVSNFEEGDCQAQQNLNGSEDEYFNPHYQGQYDDDATPKQEMSQLVVDPKSGAHFQYRELIKRLSDMTNNSQKDNQKQTAKKSLGEREKNRQVETEVRMPLKEKTHEINNQPQMTSSQKKKINNGKTQLDGKMRPYCQSAKMTKKDNGKKTNPQQAVGMNKGHLHNENGEKPMNHSQVALALASQQKIAKMLLNNQENHFIDKKLKDLQGNSNLQQNTEPQQILSANQSQLQLLNQTKYINNVASLSKIVAFNNHGNKSHQNLHKSIEKNFYKMSASSGQQQDACQINNMKLNRAQHSTNSNGNMNGSQFLKNQQIAHQTIAQQQQIIINNILSSNALSSSLSNSSMSQSNGGGASSSHQYSAGHHQLSAGGIGVASASGGGTFSSCVKCPSSANMLKTATTAAFTTTTTNKSSAKLTQCNSNKQICSGGKGLVSQGTVNSLNTKETPEASSRQKFRLTGTALSSTSKRNNGQMNSASGNGQNPVTSTLGTLSNNSQGNTIQNSHSSMKALLQQNQQQIILGHYNQNGFGDSGKKRSQNSEQKEGQNVTSKSNQAHSANLACQVNSGTNTHPSSVPRSNSSNKKISVQKMVKNQSFLKGSTASQKSDATNGSKKQSNTEFYNTVLQNLQTGKLGLQTLASGNAQSQLNLNIRQGQSSRPQGGTSNFLGQQITLQQQAAAQFGQANPQAIQPRLSDSKKQSALNQSSKTTRISTGGHKEREKENQIMNGQLIGSTLQASGAQTNPPSKPQSRLSQGKKTGGAVSTRAKAITVHQETAPALFSDRGSGGFDIENGMNQISNNIKRISDLLQLHQQSPTGTSQYNLQQQDYYSRKNSNKNFKEGGFEDHLLQQVGDKSLLSKHSAVTALLQNNNAKSSQFFMKINSESQAANNSQIYIKSNQGSSTNLAAQINIQPSSSQSQAQHHQPSSILLSHQVNKKLQSQNVQNRIPSNNTTNSNFSNPNSALNTNRPQQPLAPPQSVFDTQSNKRVSSNDSKTNQQQWMMGQTENSFNQAQNINTQQNYMNSLLNHNQQQQMNTILKAQQDNRQSLMEKHKTVEKKVAAPNQIAQRHQTNNNKKKYIQPLKEEPIDNFNKSRPSNISSQNQQTDQSQIYQQPLFTQESAYQKEQSILSASSVYPQSQRRQPVAGVTNIKIPRSSGLPQKHSQPLQKAVVTQQNEEQNLSGFNNGYAFERMHLPTEEDDYTQPTFMQRTGGHMQNNLLTQIQHQELQMNAHNQNVCITENSAPLRNLLETEMGDQFEVQSSNQQRHQQYNNSHYSKAIQKQIIVNHPPLNKVTANFKAAKMPQQQIRAQNINAMSNAVSHSAAVAGQKHSVKVQPKKF